MATKTWTPVGDARTAQLPSSQGAGASPCTHLPVGTYSGYDYQSHIRFGVDWSGILNAGRITSATLYVLRYTNYHVSPVAGTMRVRAMVSNVAFAEGTASHPMTATNGGGIVGNTRGTVDNATAVTAAIPAATGSWIGIDITAMLQAHFGDANFAVTLAADSGVYEFASREVAGGGAYIYITYNANSAPNAPTLVSPIGGALVSSQSPVLTYTHTDPDGDASSAAQVQVATDAGFTSIVWDSGALAGGVASGSNYGTTVGVTLSRGSTYYWRARTADASNGYGPWAAGTTFRVMVNPTTGVTTPANGHTARLYYVAASGTTPKLSIDWSFADGDGHAQSSVVINVYADAAGPSRGALVYTTGSLAGSATTQQLSGFTPTNGTYYWIEVVVTCAGGLTATSVSNRTRVRWGRASYYYDMGATPPTGWSGVIVGSTIPANSALVVEYSATSNAATPPPSEPGTWYANQGDVPIPAGAAHVYLWHRVTMFAWGSATPTSPSLNDVTLKWTSNNQVADFWTYGAQFSIDEANEVYGTQSLKGTGNGTTLRAYQVIDVLPNTNYMLQGRIKASGNAQAKIGIREVDDSAEVAAVAVVAATQDWTVTSVGFNSGGRTQVRMVCEMAGAGGTFAWWDAVKVDASTIVTPWTPGFVTGAASVDAGGIQVDASNGGVFRLRGSAGGARDLVELGANGLRFGGTSGLELLTDIATRLKVNGGLWINSAAFSGAYAYISGYPNTVATPASWAPSLYIDNADASGNGQGIVELRINSSRRGSLRWDNAGNVVLNPSGSGRVYLANDEGLKQIRMGANAFPAAATAADGDLFFHTGHNRLYIWLASANRWLSEQIFTVPMNPDQLEAGSVNRTYWATSLAAYGTEIWLEGVHFTFFAGTNNGTNYWNWTLNKRTAGNVATAITSGNTSALAASNWISGWASASVLLNTGTYPEIDFGWAKTGAPSAFYAPCVLALRTAFPGT